MTKHLVLLSGGMDSTVLVAHTIAVGINVEALAVDYGQRHRTELVHARQVADTLGIRLDVLDLSSLQQHLTGSALTDLEVQVPDGHYAADSMRATIVPNRNSILVMAAVGIAQSREIPVVATAVHAGDHHIYPDCRPGALQAMANLALTCTEGRVTVTAPFVQWTKTRIVQRGAAIAAPLSLTWSCYRGGTVHCGTCGTCNERREAFREADVSDPTTYLQGANS